MKSDRSERTMQKKMHEKKIVPRKPSKETNEAKMSIFTAIAHFVSWWQGQP